jgi:hypothetical protein
MESIRAMLATNQFRKFCILFCCLKAHKSKYRNDKFCLWLCMGVKLDSDMKGGTWTEDVCEQGAENIWTN